MTSGPSMRAAALACLTALPFLAQPASALDLPPPVERALETCEACAAGLEEAASVAVFNYRTEDAWRMPVFVEMLLDGTRLAEPNASYFVVGFDDDRRPVTEVEVVYGETIGFRNHAFDGDGRLARTRSFLPDGALRSTESYERNAEGMAIAIVRTDAAGAVESTDTIAGSLGEQAVVTRLPDGQESGDRQVIRYDGQRRLFRIERVNARLKYVDEIDIGNGLKRAYALYLVDGDRKAAESIVSFDRFGNRVAEQVTYLWGDVKYKKMEFDRYWRSREETLRGSGLEVFEYDNSPVLKQPVAAKFYVDGKHRLNIVVEYTDAGDAVRTVAYSPKGKKLMEYPGRFYPYFNREGTAVDGGEVKKFVKGRLW